MCDTELLKLYYRINDGYLMSSVAAFMVLHRDPFVGDCFVALLQAGAVCVFMINHVSYYNDSQVKFNCFMRKVTVMSVCTLCS